MKFGIFGGTFDPVHRCHIYIAETVRDALGLDKVYFVPAGIPPHKYRPDMASPGERLEMVRIAVSQYPGFEVIDFEAASAGVSYSIDTVQRIINSFGRNDEWFFLMGIDSFLDIIHWKDPESLLKICNFAVIPRSGYTFSSVAALPFFDKMRCTEKTDRFEKWKIEGGSDIYFINCPLCDISSTSIRIAMKAGPAPENALPAGVESYIIKVKGYKP